MRGDLPLPSGVGDRTGGIRFGGGKIKVRMRKTILNPSGFCMCGCGGSAPIATQTYTRVGIRKGEYHGFIRGHQILTQEARKKSNITIRSKECREKASQNKFGERNPQWKGNFSGLSNSAARLRAQ